MGKLSRGNLRAWVGCRMPGAQDACLAGEPSYTLLIQEPPKDSWGPCTLNPIA